MWKDETVREDTSEETSPSDAHRCVHPGRVKVPTLSVPDAPLTTGASVPCTDETGTPRVRRGRRIVTLGPKVRP